MTDSTLTDFFRRLLILILCSSLIACGGGIFGTGTGSEDNTIISPDPDGAASQEPITNETSPEPPATEDVNNIPEAPDAMPGPTSDQIEPTAPAGDTQTTLEFSNISPSGQQGFPLLKIVNVSSVSLNARSSISSPTLFDASINAFSSSDPIELPLGASSLILEDAQSSDALINVNPLNAALDTVTTLLVRTPIDTSNGTDTVIDVLALSTRVVPTAPAMALLRVVQASALGTDNLTASFTLIPQGSNPGTGEVVYADMDAQTNVVTQYQLVTPGEYAISDSQGRFVNQSLSVQADTVYTLILTGTIDNVIYLEVDGEP